MKKNLKNVKKKRKCKKSENQSGYCFSTNFYVFEDGLICQKHKNPNYLPKKIYNFKKLEE
jgi:hypothetical protein